MSNKLILAALLAAALIPAITTSSFAEPPKKVVKKETVKKPRPIEGEIGGKDRGLEDNEGLLQFEIQTASGESH